MKLKKVFDSLSVGPFIPFSTGRKDFSEEEATAIYGESMCPFGDGKFNGGEDPALQFIFRAWVLPTKEMILMILLSGISSALGGYFIAQAYRHSSASLVAPFEYCALPLAVFWGYFFWSEFPDIFSALGIVLILSSGVFVALREGRLKTEPSAKRVSGRR